jgi:hypothetical protein
MARIVTYECEECGTEVVVTESGETSLRPIYCCGLEITEVSSIPQAGGSKKKAVGKMAKKPAKGLKKAVAKSTAKAAGTTKKKTSVRKAVKK